MSRARRRQPKARYGEQPTAYERDLWQQQRELLRLRFDPKTTTTESIRLRLESADLGAESARLRRERTGR